MLEKDAGSSLPIETLSRKLAIIYTIMTKGDGSSRTVQNFWLERVSPVSIFTFFVCFIMYFFLYEFLSFTRHSFIYTKSS